MKDCQPSSVFIKIGKFNDILTWKLDVFVHISHQIFVREENETFDVPYFFRLHIQPWPQEHN